MSLKAALGKYTPPLVEGEYTAVLKGITMSEAGDKVIVDLVIDGKNYRQYLNVNVTKKSPTGDTVIPIASIVLQGIVAQVDLGLVDELDMSDALDLIKLKARPFQVWVSLDNGRNNYYYSESSYLKYGTAVHPITVPDVTF